MFGVETTYTNSVKVLYTRGRSDFEILSDSTGSGDSKSPSVKSSLEEEARVVPKRTSDDPIVSLYLRSSRPTRGGYEKRRVVS